MIERLNLAGGELREIEVQLEPESQLTLHVVNHLNNPVAGARIHVSFERFTQPQSFGRSDATGRAHVSTGTGVATVDVSHSAWLPRTVHVALEPGPNDVHIQLDPGFGISGVVSSAHQVPIPGAAVETIELNAVQDVHALSRELQLAFRSALPPAQAVSDGTGAFRLTGLARGHYRLAVRLPGSSEVSSTQDVHLTDQSVYGVQIVLYAGESPSAPARVP